MGKYKFHDIRCHFCHGLLVRVTSETAGPMEVYCKRCRKPFVLHLPLENFDESKYSVTTEAR